MWPPAPRPERSNAPIAPRGQSRRDAIRREASSRARGLAGDLDLARFAGEEARPWRDFEEALYWYEEAAKSGHIDSRITLGEMYRDGVGPDVDLAITYQWFNLEAISSEKARGEPNKLGWRLTPAQLLEAKLKSVEWLQRNPTR